MHRDNSAIDWPGIRAAALVLGVREAARQAAANLPAIEQNRFVKRVLKRSERQHWLEIKTNAVAKTVASNDKPMSSSVVTGAQSVVNGLASITHETRIGLARLAQRAVEQAIKSKNALPVSSTREFRELTSAASQIGGWETNEREGTITLNVLNVAGDMHQGCNKQV